MHLQRRSKLGRHCLRRPRNPSSQSDSVLVYYVLNQMHTFSLIQVFILILDNVVKTLSCLCGMY